MSVEIYDLLGKRVFTSIKNIDNIDIRHVNSGMYIAQIKTENGIKFQKIIFKNN
jgi:hypothetical protein